MILKAIDSKCRSYAHSLSWWVLAYPALWGAFALLLNLSMQTKTGQICMVIVSVNGQLAVAAHFYLKAWKHNQPPTML